MSDITITISSVKDEGTGSKYKRLQRQTIRMKEKETIDVTTEKTGSAAPIAEEAGQIESAADSKKRPPAQTNIATSRPRRTVKPVDRYEPTEICNDDYGASDYDTSDSDDDD